MDIHSVMEKLDQLLHASRLDEADRFLNESIRQAKQCGDIRAQQMLLNEQIGFFRDCGRFPEALDAAECARTLFEQAQETDTVSYATTLLNCANAYRAAGEYQKAFETFESVQKLYTALLAPDDERIAGYWNNLSLLYQETQQWHKACRCLRQAKAIAEKKGDTTKTAISCANLAVSLLHLGETDQALSLLTQADNALRGRTPSDFHYSAVLAGFGDAYYQLEQYDRAASYYEAALAEIELHMGQNNFYAVVSENLAQTYQKLGEPRPTLSGLALSRRYYEAFGAPMLEQSFPTLLPKLAIGLAGEGSECLGYDDAVSRDHDFGPGFCIWAPDDLSDAELARLQESYDALPKTYYGVRRLTQKQAQGRVGVCRIGDFFYRLTGLHRPPETEEEWLRADESALAAVCSGAIFRDDSGVFTGYRKNLRQGYPKAVYQRRLAQELGRMAQCGQYNYVRMRRRGQPAVAQLYLAAFCRHTMQAAHLLCGVYAPYEKWLLRSTAALPGFSGLASQIETLLLVPAKIGELTDESHDLACGQIQEICKFMAEKVWKQEKIPIPADGYLMDQAQMLADAAQQQEKQRSAAREMAEIEFHAFDAVQNVGGRAACQNDWDTFLIMRRSQYLFWPEQLLAEWKAAFVQAEQDGRNLITEKYAWMMESTSPAEFAQLKDKLPVLADDFVQLREAIVAIQVSWMEEFAARYPALAARARRIHTREDTQYDTSFETYLRGELSTYPPEVLYGYGRWLVSLHQQGKNLQEMIMGETVRAYGYKGLEEAEAATGRC